MSENDTNYQSTQTFLIECSRANSLIDTKDGGDFNAKWTNEANFNLRRGDLVSVEMMALSSENANGGSSLEFTGDAVVFDGKEKKYCDNKVLLEVFFYMNNNNTYSVGLPLRHPEGAFNALASNKYMPVVDSSLTANNRRGLTASHSTIGFLGIITDPGPPITIRDNEIVPLQSHFIYQYNTGTAAVPIWVNSIAAPGVTPVIGFQLGLTADPNPNGGIGTTYDGYKYGFLGAGILNNWCPDLQLTIQDTGGSYNVITLKTDTFLLGTATRLQVNFATPVILQQSGSALGFNQGALIAASVANVDGSSAMGTLNYDNIDQTGQVGNYVRRGNNQLSNYMKNIGKPQAGASGIYAQFPNTTYGTNVIKNANTAYDTDDKKQGFRNGNLRHECNGKPYIFTRNDFHGQGVQKPDATGYYPKLMPMTAFILLEADELFTDAESLANKINDKLHEALNPFDTDIPVMDNYVTNDEQYPNTQFKASSVIPALNSFGYYDPLIYDNATFIWSNVYNALWNTILPVKYGGTTKVQPANFSHGFDFVNTSIGQITSDLEQKIVQDGAYTQPVEITWDTVRRGQSNNNNIYGNCMMADIYKAMVGDRLQRLDLLPMNTPTSNGTKDGLCNVGCPIITNQKLDYVVGEFAVGGSTISFIATETHRNQALFTNIKFPTVNNLTNALNYDPETWKDFAESIRQYELYGSKKPNAPNNYQDQLKDPANWCVEMDLGRTNDFLSNIEQTRVTNVEPIIPIWSNKFPAGSDPITSNFGSGIGDPITSPPALTAREIISPAYSNKAFGNDAADFTWSESWSGYRGLGKIWVQSQYDATWEQSTKEMKDIFPLDPTADDTFNKLITNPENYINGDNKIDLNFIKQINLGVYPYEYTDSEGFVTVLCAFRCMYNGKLKEPQYFNGTTYTTTSVYETGCITWGLPFGVSPSAMDNHIIAPMNGDQRSSINPLKETAAPSPAVKLNRCLAQNNTNYLVAGANNPTFTFNSTKNRFEFVNLQTDNLLSSLNQNTAALSSTNPQVGEAVGIVYGTQADAVYNIPDPVVKASSADNYTKTIKNQGIRAEIGGVGIFKVWLCPPDYEVPENINPVNYWNNTTLESTEINRQSIINNCIEATDDEWEGSLLSRLGFNIQDFIPRYGRQFNRYDPNTYNNSNVNIIGNGIKPLLLNNSFNGVVNPSINLYHAVPAPVAPIQQISTTVASYTTSTAVPDLVTPQPDLVVPQPDLVTPQPDIYTPEVPEVPEVPEIPEVPESTIIYNSTADGSVALVSDFDVANNVSPMVLGNGAKLFTDDGGLSNDYSTSHSRHATFDAGSGNCIYINVRDFEFEHSSFSMYDRLGITCSNTVGGLSLSSGNLSSVDSSLSQYLYQSSNSSPSSFWGTSWVSGNGGYGTGGGWIFPNSAGTDVKGNNNSGWINTWYKIDSRYVRFWMKSDGSSTEPGWDILVARAVTTPAVPAVPAVPAIPAIPGFYTPQPDLVTPQPDLIVPQPDLLTPQPPILQFFPAVTTTTTALSSSTPVPNGTPKFLHGFNENQEVLLSTQPLPLTAGNAPIATISPFFIVYSDIVANRQYQSGATPLPAIFYCMKNYANGSFLYGYGSSFAIMVNQDQQLSQINTEIRNPTDGKLAKLSPNSVIVYKIQRQATVPAPPINVFGQLTEQPQPDPNLQELTKIFNEEKKIATGISNINTTRSGGGSAADYKNKNHLHNMVAQNVRTLNEDKGVQAVQDTRETGSGRMPTALKKKMVGVLIKGLLAKIPVGKSGNPNKLDPNSIDRLPRVINNVIRQFQQVEGMSLSDYVEKIWEQSGGDIDVMGQQLLGQLGSSYRIGVNGDVKFDEDAKATKSNPLQITITDDGLMNAIERDVLENRDVSDLINTGIQNGHIVAEGVQRQRGENPMFYDINLRSGQERIFAKPKSQFTAQGELARIIQEEASFGGSKQSTGEQKVGRQEDTKSTSSSSTTAPPSSVRSSGTQSTQDTERVDPSGRPETKTNTEKK